MNQDLRDLLSRPTASVPDVGRICYGLSRNSSYEAAKKGHIQTIQIGKQLKVPTAPLRAKLGLETT
jgi:hypothetical protein